jgi:uncharacterized protein (DUF1499 family)
MDPTTTRRSPVARVAMALGWTALAVSVGALLLLLLAGPGSRMEWWHFRTGFAMLRWGAYAGMAGAALGLLALLASAAYPLRRTLAAGAAALLLGATAVYLPWQWQRTARAAPPIHDLTTAPEDPPEFRAIVPLRADAPNPPEYAGEETAVVQRRAYPDLAPAHLPGPRGAAFERALRAARGMGWEIVSADPDRGIIEASHRTPWFGFVDDVVIRVRDEGDRVRVDVRSKSRVGRGDTGTNARRIRAYLARLERT